VTDGPPAPEAGGPGSAVPSVPPVTAVPVAGRVGIAGPPATDAGPGIARTRPHGVVPDGTGAEIEELGGRASASP
jgi:hypothetical protein